MRFVDEFRDGAVARRIEGRLREEATGRRYRLMEFCGGHTHALWRYGIVDMLPDAVEMIHGPGCPVCVLPIGRLEQAIAIARRPNVTLCTFGDMMRVPARDRKNLLLAKAEGADVRMVYSGLDALALARAEPDRQIVFFAIGFETTTPATAAIVKAAERERLSNFSVLVNHVLTPAAIAAILDAKHGRVEVDGFLGPGHVSTILGTEPYEPFARQHEKPVVVSGFEPLDLLQSILMLVRQLNEGRCEVENEYDRAVVRGGNRTALALLEEVFERRPSFEWRGLGALPDSALRLRPRFSAWDAEQRWDVPYETVAEPKGCACPRILRGLEAPTDCKLFGTGCTPDAPVGACMVSPEGSCAAYYAYGRLSKKVRSKGFAT